jgi:F-type H+-transporting ATPase subunit epsilon
MMHLVITEPARVVADFADVVSVRAEDASGSFGILSGHADLITVLIPSVVTWHHADGHTGCCAVRGGVFSVHAGREVAIATRQAQLSDNLATLEDAVRERFRADLDEERRARVASTKMHAAVMRQIIRALHPDGSARVGDGA